MANLSNSQTELLKYLNSQLLETQKERKDTLTLLAHWIKFQDEPASGLEAIIDYEINKFKATYEVLEVRFKWLHTQLEAYVPSLK
jgi:arginyl-tRNA synthetase